MKVNRLFGAGVWGRLAVAATLALLGVVPGCGDDSDEAAPGGAAGESGSAGAAGAGGSGAGAGQGGTVGGGAAGEGGSSGGSGQAGEGGSSGGSGQAGAGGSSGGSGQAGAAGQAGSGELAPVKLALSASGHDRLLGVTHDAQGNIVATGYAAPGVDAATDFASVVARFLPDGKPDPTFGANGVVTLNVAPGTNGEVMRGVVVQSTGKIVIAGTVEHAGASDARDRDIAVVRFNADGQVDTTFGQGGVVTLDLSEGELVGETYVADGHWGLTLLADDKLIVTGSQKAAGRTDADFAVVRLQADGQLDASFGTGGVFTLDINQQGASPRNATLLPDGSVVVAGYTRDADNIVSPVLFKLTTAGALDPTFGVGGVFNQIILASVTEAYGAALQGSSLVTAGYGRDKSEESIDWLSLRITGDGKFDTTYGASGVARLDVNDQADNARALVVLPDERVFLVGGGKPTAENTDGMIAVLTRDGQPDVTFAPEGRKLVDFGAPTDFFWAVSISPDQKSLALVGAAAATADSGNHDDAVLLVMPTP